MFQIKYKLKNPLKSQSGGEVYQKKISSFLVPFQWPICSIKFFPQVYKCLMLFNSPFECLIWILKIFFWSIFSGIGLFSSSGWSGSCFTWFSNTITLFMFWKTKSQKNHVKTENAVFFMENKYFVNVSWCFCSST